MMWICSISFQLQLDLNYLFSMIYVLNHLICECSELEIQWFSGTGGRVIPLYGLYLGAFMSGKWKPRGHFWVTFRLCVKMSLCAKPFRWKWVSLTGSFSCKNFAEYPQGLSHPLFPSTFVVLFPVVLGSQLLLCLSTRLPPVSWGSFFQFIIMQIAFVSQDSDLENIYYNIQESKVFAVVSPQATKTWRDTL